MQIFDQFYNEIISATEYTDLLQIILGYYLNDSDCIWYMNLLENKRFLKKQIQIGIFYDMPQTSVSRKLSSIRIKIKEYLKDLTKNKHAFIYVLQAIKKYGTEKQQEVLVRYLQHKSFRIIAKELNINYATAAGHVRHFKLMLSRQASLYVQKSFYQQCNKIRKI